MKNGAKVKRIVAKAVPIARPVAAKPVVKQAVAAKPVARPVVAKPVVKAKTVAAPKAAAAPTSILPDEQALVNVLNSRLNNAWDHLVAIDGLMLAWDKARDKATAILARDTVNKFTRYLENALKAIKD